MVLISCESSGDGTAVAPPNIDLDCSDAKCAVAGFRDAVVVLSLSGCAPDQITFETPAATGNVQLVCNGTACSGTLSQWSKETVPSRAYWICGWIDIDDDNFIDETSDAFSDDRAAITGSALTITNWSVTYSSLFQRTKK